MEIVVAFATAAEFSPWQRFRRFRQTGIAGVSEAEIGKARVRAIVTGIGPRRASEIAARLAGPPPELCVASGLAGGLRPEHASGRILAAREAQPAQGCERVGSDKPLLDLAGRCGATCVDRFVTSDVIVCSSAAKRELGKRADAVDMESFAIMKEMHRVGIPVVAIRAIADAVDRELPEELARIAGGDGSLRWTRVAWMLARRPLAIPDLVGFGVESWRAASSLAAFLDRWVQVCAEELQPASVRVAETA